MTIRPDISELKRLFPSVDIIEEIGFGGFKVVYKAAINGKIEAFKAVQIPADPEDEEVKTENLKRIFREIDILSSCVSPYMVRLGSVKRQEVKIGENDFVVYSEELISGRSLRQELKERHKPDIGELRTLAQCLLLAIKELSAKNIIHRDIKPDNIIKTSDAARPFILLDFGIAFLVGGSNLTHDQRGVPGTLAYIAPEMLDPDFRQNLDYRADLYNIGLTLYEYASAVNPYARRDEFQYTTLSRIKNEVPKSLLSLRPDLPASFCGLVDGLTKKLPALRPRNLDVILKQLEGIQ